MIFRKVHKYLARLLVFFFISMIFSGSILLYKEEIINSSLCIAKDSFNILNKNTLEDNINKLKNIKSISFTENNYYKISLSNSDTIFFSSSNSQRIDCKYIAVLNFFTKLHHTFYINKYFIFFIGIGICFLFISGLFLVKKNNLKKIFKKRNSFKILHIKVGLIFFPFLLIYILSGTLLPLKSFFIKTFFTQEKIYPIVKLQKNNEAINFIKLFEKISNKIKDARITRIYFPKNNSSEYVFRIKYLDEVHPNGKSYLVINPITYQIIENIDARKHPLLIRLIENIYTFHSAKYENKIYPFLVLFISFILIFLSLRILKR